MITDALIFGGVWIGLLIAYLIDRRMS